jgi:DNA end-binding protein Ku
MPRAIWSGAISFGLVNIPVKLYSAVNRKTVRFHQLDRADKQRIQQKRVNPRTEEEVPYENLVKGYEVGSDRYVVITPEELEALEPEKSRTIDIEDFVELDQIDPIYYDHPYYLAPDTGAQKAYRLLLDAMKEAGKVAIARVVIRSKEHLVAVRPRDDVLAMETMLFADEVIPAEALDELPQGAERPVRGAKGAEGAVKTSKRELDMARQLIESLSGDFEPDKYHDEYRERVLDLIERKAEGEEIVLEAPPEEPKKVPDLMAALEASIADAKRQGGSRAKPKRKREAAQSADGAGGSRSRSSSRKKTTKKS